jgi:hypothetical protein
MSNPSDAKPQAEPAKGFARARSAAVDAARATVPVFKTVGTRLGDWLATVGWGKFLLVALLLLIFFGIASSVLEEGERAIVVQRPSGERVNVDIVIGEEGVRIQAPTAPGAVRRPPQPPSPPSARDADVRIDDQGVRIVSRRDGKSVALIVDDQGVRIERVPAPAAADASSDKPAGAVTIERDGRAIIIPPEVAQNPEQLAQAIAGARDQIRSIVEDQVSRQVTREVRRQQSRDGGGLMLFAVLLIVAGIIVKVVLGGKQRAERRAQAATATAAEESLKRQLAEAHLKMMQAQVEPHFLFNTLASVDYLIETDPPTASKMQKNLIQYLRAALPQMREGSTTLGKEVQLCRSYLEILKFRMEDRLQYSVTVPQGLASAQFPPMMLQSLVENSIKHGLEPKPEGGSVTISADVVNGRLRVTVADTGLGLATAGQGGTGVGLANVRERLAALYGGTARLSIEANTPTGTIVIIEVPYTFQAGS